eukprot:CCRYP_015086-RB/>CCRYP_015086-RB protein AED:0.28 eAED:1.00 QI:0/0/0/1/1/1/2/0/896
MGLETYTKPSQGSDFLPTSHEIRNDASDEGVFVMTAVPGVKDDSTHQREEDTGQDERDFFQEIGYHDFVKSFCVESDQNLSEDFAKLRAKANECQELKRSLDDLESNLKTVRKEATASRERDAIEQKQSDDLLEQIREMEDRAIMIETMLLPQARQRIQEMEANNAEIQRKILKGPGWTEEQEAERAQLAEAYNQSQNEADEINNRMSTLRLSVQSKEQKVESLVKQRDQLNFQLDMVEEDMAKANRNMLAKKQAVDNERTKHKEWEMNLEQLKSELSDLDKERDEAKEDADLVATEVENIRAALVNVANDHTNLIKSHAITTDELEAIKKENIDITCINAEMSKTLDLKRSEHRLLLKERSKMAKLLELIDQKTNETENERKTLENKMAAISVETAQIERIELPMLAKENETSKREIRRLLMELQAINRKVDLAKKGSLVAQDLSKSYMSTLKSHERIKKAVHESEIAKARIDEDLERDEARLEKLLDTCKEKQMQLNNMKARNRELESATACAEEKANRQRDRCEVEREEHNKQSKVLMDLRDDIRNTKREFGLHTEQIRKAKSAILRADDLISKEHSRLHRINEERHAIENDIKCYNEQSSDLKSRREKNAIAIDNLCREIDSADKRREELRKQLRQSICEKDIIASFPNRIELWRVLTYSLTTPMLSFIQGAQVVATQAEIDRMQQNMKSLQSALELGSHRFTCLKKELEEAHQRNQELLDENRRMNEMFEIQKEQSEFLAQLEYDISRQRGKNQLLAIEVGRPINLHRWRHIQNSDPVKWSLIEKVHKLQKQVISSTDRVASQSSIIESKKKLLAKLKHEVSNQSSVESIKSQLLRLKSNYQELNKEIKVNDLELQQMVEKAECLKGEVLQLEKKRLEMKSAYIVSVIGSH